jgi:hypothetical protein
MNTGNRPKRPGRQSLLVAALLLIAIVASWWYFAGRSEEARQETLAGVPDFPTPGQVIVRREPNQKLPVRAQPAKAPPAPASRKPDRLNAFALAPGHSVSVIQVNALFNTPLFDRFHACAPKEFGEMEKSLHDRGVDLEKDIDRIAMVPGGFAINGFFDGKPIAETFAHADDGNTQKHEYRGQTIYTLPNGGCASQQGNLIVVAPAGSDGCEPLIDRTLDTSASEEQEQELYGDLYARSDLQHVAQGESGPVEDLLNELSGVTVRANVWDDVAVSLEGTPADGDKLRDLTNMARGAVSLAKSQLGEDDDKLQALADLAKVQSEGGKLKVDLALPADELFSRMHLPCPGLEGKDAGP